MPEKFVPKGSKYRFVINHDPNKQYHPRNTIEADVRLKRALDECAERQRKRDEWDVLEA